MIVTLLIMACLLIMGMFLLDHLLIQSRINQNMYLELKTYYLAQAGIEYAAYRLKEDSLWRVVDFNSDLFNDGKIILEVIDLDPYIKVISQGIYERYQLQTEAYFTKSPPVQRIQ